jgi:ferritin-like metal-binding protein YciE
MGRATHPGGGRSALVDQMSAFYPKTTSTMPLANSLMAILIEEIAELYHLECRLTGLLPKMAQKASDAGLRLTMTRQMQETQERIRHLRRSIDLLGADAHNGDERPVAMLVIEDDEWMERSEAGPAADANLLCIALKIENYKAAGYLNAATFARLLELSEVAGLLELSMKRSSGLTRKVSRWDEGMDSRAEEDSKAEAFL